MMIPRRCGYVEFQMLMVCGTNLEHRHNPSLRPSPTPIPAVAQFQATQTQTEHNKCECRRCHIQHLGLILLVSLLQMLYSAPTACCCHLIAPLNCHLRVKQSGIQESAQNQNIHKFQVELTLDLNGQFGQSTQQNKNSILTQIHYLFKQMLLLRIDKHKYET